MGMPQLNTPAPFTGIELWLARFWWLIFPAFGAMTARLSMERTSGGASQLLPQATSDPSLAWLLAIIYVAAHWWLLLAYLVTVRRTQMLFPNLRVVRIVWGSESPKLLLLFTAFALEYLPLSMWQAIGVWLGPS